jgi:hypothetical protein
VKSQDTKIILLVGSHNDHTIQRWLQLLDEKYEFEVEVLTLDEYSEMKKNSPDFFVFDELPKLMVKESLPYKQHRKETPIWQKKNRWA